MRIHGALVLVVACLGAMGTCAASRMHRVEVHVEPRGKLTLEFGDADTSDATLAATAATFVQQEGLPAEAVHTVLATMRRRVKQAAIAAPGAVTRPTCLLRHWHDVLLVVLYTSPHFASVPLLRRLYGDAFPHMR
jgi:hypothetical protein